MTDTAARTPIPRIISVDDHIVEPPHLWQAWLPERFRERGPRVERRRLGEMKWVGGAKMYEYELGVPDAPWCDVWFFEDLVHPNKRHVAAVGFDRDEMTLSPITYDEMRPGCYEPKARVADMAANHVDVSLSFPTFPRFCGQTFWEASDHELGLACVKAYNDFMVEEWCGDSGGALVPLIIIPLWDVDLAAAEVRRNAERGCRAACFSEIAPNLGLPSIHTGYWDPFFAACAETGTVVCMHIGSSSKMPAASPDAPPAVAASLSFNNAIASLSDFLFSGVLVWFPELVLAYSEARSAGSPTSWSGPTTSGRSIGRGVAWPTSFRSRHPPTTTGRSTAASSGTTMVSPRSTRSGSTTSRSRPTIRTPTPPGRTRSRWPKT